MGCDDGDANFSTVFTVSRSAVFKKRYAREPKLDSLIEDTKTQVMISMSMNETRGKCNEHVPFFR